MWFKVIGSILFMAGLVLLLFHPWAGMAIFFVGLMLFVVGRLRDSGNG